MISGSRVRGVNYLASSASKVGTRRAAKKLGSSRRTLHRKINEMNLGKAPAKTTDTSGSKV
jgi:DNA-binding NtrC family response regulator